MDKLYKSVIEELKSGEKTAGEIRKKYRINHANYINLITNLTYLIPVYEYKAGERTTVLGLL